VKAALADPLPLPCGAVLPNRLAKAAMTEGLADPLGRATARHTRLYRSWADGGVGLSITGNVMIDARILERPGNVVIDRDDPRTHDATALARLADWARAGSANGSRLWMQISHAGRQSPRYVTAESLAPSPVPLELYGSYAAPRAITEAEIRALPQRFAFAAGVAREAGFDGVQVHSAHGYLLSSFLSPVTNRREDAWGGPIERRARLLLEVLAAVRARVGPDYPVAVKLNSDDFRKGGFTSADCLRVVEMLGDSSIDLLEISGGTYEQPRLLGAAGVVGSEVPLRPSTRAREAYFLEYAHAIRGVAQMPLMVTGGFRSRDGMQAALADGDCDLVGLARPLCTEPDLPRRLLLGEAVAAVRHERDLVLRRTGPLSPASPYTLPRALNLIGAMGWYYHQIERLADGQPPDTTRGLLASLASHYRNEFGRARAIHRARRVA
jgi:2,4-dienoyl-CoA reductase-like NADH-dependent reductase (Old Yellow Enzyme family)